MPDKPPTPIGRTFNPGGARWCTEHAGIQEGRLECTKLKSKSREQCHAPAIRGTNACKQHGGISRAVAKAKGEAVITAWSAIGAGAEKMDHKMAVLAVLQMTWLRLAAYSEMLRQQYEKDGEDEPKEDFNPKDAVTSAGLIGFRYGAAGKDGHIYTQNEEVRALVILEAAERDKVVKYAKVAHDMGISDRLTSLAERWGDVVATRITIMLEQLDLTPQQTQRVPQLIQAHLGTIDMDMAGGDGK